MTNIKYLKKISKKDYSEAIILTITYIIAREFFSDFDHFIAGLFGF